MSRPHDVVVAGGGVVGAAAALALARMAFDVALVERAPPAPFAAAGYDPRVYALSPGSVRFLETLGVWRAVAAARVSPYQRMEIWDRDAQRALTFDAAECGTPELGFIVEESALRTALWSALGGVRVSVGHELAGFGVRDDRAWVRLDDGAVLEGALAVAAEGADSRLRQWVGIDTPGWSYEQRAVVCHVATAQPHRQTAYQRFLPGGPLAFLPLADGRSSIVWSAPAAQAAELLALPDAEFRAQLGDALQHRLGEIVQSTPRLSFPLRLAHAQEYVRPQLALAGDAAHVIHPMAGQGVNLGLSDVRELAAVLGAARGAGRPLGDLRVLKRYERARRGENLEMLALTETLHRAFARRAPAWNALLNFGLDAVNRIAPLKRRLTVRAMGL